MTTATDFEMNVHYEMAEHRGYNPSFKSKSSLFLNIVNPDTGKLYWNKKQLRELMVAGYDNMLSLRQSA